MKKEYSLIVSGNGDCVTVELELRRGEKVTLKNLATFKDNIDSTRFCNRFDWNHPEADQSKLVQEIKDHSNPPPFSLKQMIRNIFSRQT